MSKYRTLVVLTAAALATASCMHRAPPDVRLGLDAFQRGYAALQAEDWPTAERDFDEAARLMPDDAFTQLDLGVTEQNLGHETEARAAYARAIDLGKTVKPRNVGDPLYAGRTVAELAQDDLASMDKNDPKPKSGGAAQH